MQYGSATSPSHWTADVSSRRRLRSAATSTLVLTLTRRSTLGDRAFPVAASRKWNSLPASVRDIQSLPAFRQKLKLTLFSDSFASWIQHLMDCLSCLDFSLVWCPCNSLLWQRHLNLCIYNNNNNNSQTSHSSSSTRRHLLLLLLHFRSQPIHLSLQLMSATSACTGSSHRFSGSG